MSILKLPFKIIKSHGVFIHQHMFLMKSRLLTSGVKSYRPDPSPDHCFVEQFAAENTNNGLAMARVAQSSVL